MTLKVVCRCFAAVACWHVFASAAAHAQIPPIDTLRLGEAAVSGSRDSRWEGEAPQIDTLDFRRQGLVSLSDALSRFAGTVVRDYGGAGGIKSVSVRGFSAQHTAVSYDGITLSDSRAGQIDLSRFSLEGLQSIRLVTASSSTFPLSARSAATSALVDLQTRATLPPKGHPSLTAALSGGSFGRINPSVSYANRLTPNVALTVSGSYFHAENDYPYTVKNGPETQRLYRKNSRLNRWNGESTLTWTIHNGHQLDAKLYYYDSRQQLPGPRILYKEDNHERLAEREAFAQATYSWRPSPRLNVVWRGKFDYRSSHYTDERDVYPEGRLEQTYREREAYTSASAAWYPLRQLSFSLSMDYAWSALGSNQPSDDGAARHSLWQNLMVRWKSGRFSLTASIVGQQFLNHAPSETAAQNFSRFTPAVLADWQPFSRSVLSFRAFYKEMYRPPTFTENYYYHYGSTRLRPERTRQMGVGTTLRSQKGDAELTVDAYHNTVHDKITAVPVNLYLWRMTNTGLADIWGTDVALHVRRNFSGNWLLTLAGRYTFQQVEDRTTRGSSTYGRQLAYTPRHSGGASLACETPWLGGTVYVNAAGERFSLPSHAEGTRLKPYAELGAALYHTFALRDFRLDARLDATNLTATDYEVIARYPMPGRAFSLTLKFIW